MTLPELRVWGLLRRRQFGERFNRQEPIGKYVADFICHKARLIVEIDGGYHFHENNDLLRDSWLESQGWHILRISNHEVRRDIGMVSDKIAMALRMYLPPLP
jgi:very-short-patch-repair endonuclease